MCSIHISRVVGDKSYVTALHEDKDVAGELVKAKLVQSGPSATSDVPAKPTSRQSETVAKVAQPAPAKPAQNVSGKMVEDLKTAYPKVNK